MENQKIESMRCKKCGAIYCQHTIDAAILENDKFQNEIQNEIKKTENNKKA
jgi:uncharacterized OB-fold protein